MLGVFLPFIYEVGEKNAFRRFGEEEYKIRMVPPLSDLPGAVIYLHTLEQFGFRVLALKPAGIGSAIEGFTIEHDPRKSPGYTAQKFAWGDGPGIHPITINDQRKDIQP